MALAMPELLDAAITDAPKPVVAPLIAPTSAPVYVPAVSVPMLPAPTIAPPPPNQFRGEGGTAFGSIPQLYVHAPVPAGLDGDAGLYVPPPNTAYNPATPVPTPPETRPRPGDSTIQPVPTGQQPAKAPIAPAVESVTVPKSAGPIKGSFLGFDLGMVPLWAWLVGAALVGARVLR